MVTMRIHNVARMILAILIIIDINECLNNDGGCSHNCTNTVGSYYCKCPDGYVLQSNNRDCEGKC